MAKIKKKIKTIKIESDKCNGCRACEVICSAFHATPKYSSNNPARSRICKTGIDRLHTKPKLFPCLCSILGQN